MPTEAEVGQRLALELRHSRSVAALAFEPGAAAGTGRTWLDAIGNRPALVVADPNTVEAAGHAAARSLGEAGIPTRLHVIRQPVADRALGDALAECIADDEHFLAVGAGVINDLVKYAAFRQGKPYACVATAASMDGYTSAGSSLSDRGFKKTIHCRPPAAVIGDLEVIASAPRHLAGRGFGDIAGKVPAGADWILSDELGIEAVDGDSFGMVQDSVAAALAESGAVGDGNQAATATLFGALLSVGFAMELHGSSRPASGADHQIAHLWEMKRLVHSGRQVGHGNCVAVGCVAVLRLYEWLLASDHIGEKGDITVDRAPDMAAKRRMIKAHFRDEEVAVRAEAETRDKHLDASAHRNRLDAISACWPDLRQRLSSHLVDSRSMGRMLRRAGAPAEPDDIGLNPSDMRDSIRAARFLRSRYTVLDLLDEVGLLDEALMETFP